MLLQTDIWSVIGVVLAGILAGAIGTWIFLQCKRNQSQSPEAKEKEARIIAIYRDVNPNIK